MKEKETERKVDKKFQEIIAEWKAGREVIREKRKSIKGMKNKKAGDKNNSKVEWIEEGGDEMAQSLAILFNRVIQWK